MQTVQTNMHGADIYTPGQPLTPSALTFTKSILTDRSLEIFRILFFSKIRIKLSFWLMHNMTHMKSPVFPQGKGSKVMYHGIVYMIMTNMHGNNKYGWNWRVHMGLIYAHEIEMTYICMIYGTGVYTLGGHMQWDMGLAYGQQNDIYLWDWRLCTGKVLLTGMKNMLETDKYTHDIYIAWRAHLHSTGFSCEASQERAMYVNALIRRYGLFLLLAKFRSMKFLNSVKWWIYILNFILGLNSVFYARGVRKFCLRSGPFGNM